MNFMQGQAILDLRITFRQLDGPLVINHGDWKCEQHAADKWPTSRRAASSTWFKVRTSSRMMI